MRAVVLRRVRSLAQFAGHAALPASLLIVLAVASGLVRTAALAVFVLVVVLKGAMAALELLADLAPTPRVRWEVSR